MSTNNRKRKRRRVALPIGPLLILAVIIAFVLILVLGFKGCGVSHKTPEGVVRSMMRAYGSGSQKKVKDCYNARKNTSEELQKEIDAVLAYFKAHRMSKLEIQNCDVMSTYNNYSFVYITYHLVLDDGQEYPCLSMYVVVNEDDKYYVVEPSNVTEEMSAQAAQDYTKFMTSDIYKEYQREYDTFSKKNPGYEEKIAERLAE